VQVVVVGDLSHVIVEEPAAGILFVGDFAELAPQDLALGIGGLPAVDAEDGHRHLTRIAVADHESHRTHEL